MKYLCSLSDYNYLHFGLVMFESLKKHFHEDFRLAYLCLDDKTYNIVNNIYQNIDKRIRPFKLQDLNIEEKLKNFDKKPNGYCEYSFTLASQFTNWCITNQNEPFLYIDSDICFYHNTKNIYDEIGNKSIGIIKHRHNVVGCHVGGYNVGIIYFSNDTIGKQCCKWWSDVVIDKSNKYFKTHGHCGDQKYLELFEPLFGKENICVIDKTVGHAAPWNFRLYKYIDNDIIYNNIKQPMNFIHYSHFTLKQNGYDVQRKDEWGDVRKIDLRIKEYYDDYYNNILNIKNKYKLI